MYLSGAQVLSTEERVELRHARVHYLQLGAIEGYPQ